MKKLFWILFIFSICSILSISMASASGTIQCDNDNNGAMDIDCGGTNATTVGGALNNLGLGNVNNTSDINKPISTAMQNALNNKVNTSSVTITPTADMIPQADATGHLGSGWISPAGSAYQVQIKNETGELGAGGCTDDGGNFNCPNSLSIGTTGMGYPVTPDHTGEWGWNNLKSWRSAIAMKESDGASPLGYDNPTVVLIGDSWMNTGIGIAAALRAKLQTLYGNTGPGYIGLDATSFGTLPPEITASSRQGTWTDSVYASTSMGIQGRDTSSSDTSSPGAWSITTTATDFVLHYTIQPGGGIGQFQVDSLSTGLGLNTDSNTLNFLNDSQNFTTGWTTFESTVASATDGTLDPITGTNAAFVLTETTSGGGIYQLIPPANFTGTYVTHSWSVYAKAGTGASFSISTGVGGEGASCTFTLSTVSSLVSGGTGYQVGDVLTLIGGVVDTQPLQFTVTSVDPTTGAIIGLTVSQYGNYLWTPSGGGIYGLTGGHGLNADCYVTFPSTSLLTGPATNPKIEFAGNGWYRCSITVTNIVGGGDYFWIFGANGVGKTMYLWGAQASSGFSTAPYCQMPPASPNNGTHYATLHYSGLTNASHHFNFAVSAAGTTGVKLQGIEPYIANASGIKVGASVHGVAAPGAQAATYLGLPSTSWQTAMKSLDPNVVVLQFGVNELAGNVTPVSQISNFTTLIGWIHTACPRADIVLITPADIGITGTYGPMANYAAAQFGMAQANGYGWINLTKELGPTWATGNLRGIWLNTSHPNVYGGQLIADAVNAFLTRGF